jgi:iron(III) transport system ATP-binding protein
MSAIELRGVAKRFGATPVLTDIDLVVPPRSMTAVLGASGSGKTTLLRLIAGFEQLDAGTISIGGRVVDDGQRAVRPQHRGVGYVPQDGALFPHLTVAGNVNFGVGRHDRQRVADLLDMVGLGGLGRRYPHQLSGGQQQRVALARALAVRPAVVLLDEPFSSLDASLRTGLRHDVARILAEAGTTTVLVTHDQDEALAMADQIAVLGNGRVVASADPRTLYANPPDLVAATSIGETNVMAAFLRDDEAACALGTVALRPDGHPPFDGPGTVVLRPEQLILHASAERGLSPATVVEVQYHGHDALAYVHLDDPQQPVGLDDVAALLPSAAGPTTGQPVSPADTLLVRVAGDEALAPGQTVWVEVRGPVRAWSLESESVLAVLATPR